MYSRLMQLVTRAGDLLMQHQRYGSLYGGAAVVALWTTIRSITNGVNFDVVGQIGLANQWIHGLSGGAQVGATNYILKIPFYIALNGLSFVSPQYRILLLALLFNVITYVVIFKLMERILALHSIKDSSWLHLGMFWLATIFGNVFWADYANSRNIEVAGGILFLYLVLKYLQERRPLTAVMIAGFGSVVFFADPLQLYVVGFGCILYAVQHGYKKRNSKDILTMSTLVVAIVAAALGAKLLATVTKLTLPVSYLAAPNAHQPLTYHNVAKAIKQSALSTLDTFGANIFKQPYSLNSIRELLNAAMLFGLIWVVFKGGLRRHGKHQLFAVAVCILIANYIIYVVSGQALNDSTSRYLIVVPVVFVLLVSFAIPRAQPVQESSYKKAWLAMIVFSSLLLVGGLVIAWPNRYSKDQHIYATITYLQQNNFKYAIGSREAAVTTTYYARDQQVVLPVSCLADKQLHIDSLFYDQDAFQNLRGYTGEVPIIVRPQGIVFGSFTCSPTDIIAQFGQPKRTQSIPNIGTAYIYNGSTIKLTAR